MSKPIAVLFDFHGVLCTDYFYTNLLQEYPSVFRFISENIFYRESKLVDDWTRGLYSYNDINLLISKSTDIPFEKLTELFIASVRNMKLNTPLIQFAVTLKQNGTKIALVTDNMDIFNEITIPEKALLNIFPVIVNSFDYGILKNDEDGKLFDITLKKLRLDSYKDVWLIDDSSTSCGIIKAKGGNAYQYTQQDKFESWIKQSELR